MNNVSHAFLIATPQRFKKFLPDFLFPVRTTQRRAKTKEGKTRRDVTHLLPSLFPYSPTASSCSQIIPACDSRAFLQSQSRGRPSVSPGPFPGFSWPRSPPASSLGQSRRASGWKPETVGSLSHTPGCHLLLPSRPAVSHPPAWRCS